MSAPERRLIDRHGTWGLLGCTRVGPFCELPRYGGRVKWKVALAIGAVAGGAVWYVRRKSRRAEADAELWAEATDPIIRFGNA